MLSVWTNERRFKAKEGRTGIDAVPNWTKHIAAIFNVFAATRLINNWGQTSNVDVLSVLIEANSGVEPNKASVDLIGRCTDYY